MASVTARPPAEEAPVLEGHHTLGSATDKINDIVLKDPIRKGWLGGLLIAFSILSMLMISVAYLFAKGVGIWGLNAPVMWAWDITNFVWWIGIGHAGTLISAILLLLKQEWRTSINRFAEAMTLFAVACAGMYPLIHLGRPWVFYWLMPYPNTMRMWPQWRSPLVFDVFAVSTYATVSLLFWFVGLVPDFASLRDQSKTTAGRTIYGILSLGWRGASRHWHRYRMAYLLLAGLSTPLVVSVHSIVSLDFTIGIVPGWHTTIFPPYFVAGAIFSGFAMVVTLMVPLRWYYNLYDFITPRHLDNMAKLMLATGLIVTYGYFMEGFMAWYSGNIYEKYMLLKSRPFGQYSPQWWMMILCNCILINFLWFPVFRRNVYFLWVLCIFINIGMWLERFVIIVTSLSNDFLPSSWGTYRPTMWDISTYIGSIGLFLTLLFLFVRVLPVIAVSELRELVHHKSHHGAHSHHDAAAVAEGGKGEVR